MRNQSTADLGKRKSHPGRDRVLDDKELAALWQATQDEDHYNQILRLILLTGCRREEIGRSLKARAR
jgi:hypothetical protein